MSTSELDSDFDSDNEQTPPISNNDPESAMDDSGRLRLRPDIALDGEEYVGKKGSRKAAFDEDFDLDNSLEDDAFEQAADWSRRLRDARGSGSSDEGEDNNNNRGFLGARDEELDALNEEYEKLREEEEQGLEILRAQDTGDQRKAKSVRNQKGLWDKSLEIRISLQKMLAGSNRLPRKAVRDVMSQEHDQIKEGYSRLTESAVQALNSLMELEAALIENNSAINETYSTTPNTSREGEASHEKDRETMADNAWKNIDNLNGKLVPYRDNALDRWQRKTQIYSGAIAKVKLRAFNQNVSQQVASAMRDSSRVISRTRLKRGSVHVLGQPLEETETKVLESDRLSNADADSAGKSIMDEGDPETYDDSEFYQQLLRELLEASDPTAASSMGLYANLRYQNKKRKVVDRRASKGRKLRYNVFEPLLNFMAPKPVVVPSIAAKLFSNLLGQKPSSSRIATS